MIKAVTGADFGPLGNKLVAATGIALLATALVITIWATWRALGLAHDSWRARHWPATQATVLHASLVAQGEPRRLGFYPARVKFRYVEGGKEYESGRLVFTGQSTQTQEIWNGLWLAKIVEYLENARVSGRPVPVFVNPGKADDAVLFRELHWGNFLWRALAASTAGFALALGSWVCLRRFVSRSGANTTAWLIALASPLLLSLGALITLLA